MIDCDKIRRDCHEAMIDMKMKSNTINQLNQTSGECESRLNLIELEKFGLKDGKRACVKNVSVLEAIVKAAKNSFSLINHSSSLQT